MDRSLEEEESGASAHLSRTGCVRVDLQFRRRIHQTCNCFQEFGYAMVTTSAIYKINPPSVPRPLSTFATEVNARLSLRKILPVDTVIVVLI